jgi:hypothetical protein
MRLSMILRASFVGSLLFTPAMADEVQQVHEEALRVLHQLTGQGAQNTTPAPASNANPSGGAEAQKNVADESEAERRARFEKFVKDRERLREEQRAYDENVARQTGQVKGVGSDDLQSKALEALHAAERDPGASLQAQHVPSQDAVRPSSSRVSEAEMAPRMLAAAGDTALPPKNSDVHAQALDALHKQTQAQDTMSKPSTFSGSATTAPAPKPSPELEQRLRQMQQELEQEQLQRNRAASSSAVPDDYVKDLEQRAKQQAGQATPSVAPGLDPRTREILHRQDEEIRRVGNSSVGMQKPAATATGSTLSPQEEARARELLRQQEAISAVAPAPAALVQAPAATAAPGPGSNSNAGVANSGTVSRGIVTENPNVQYSKELEDRARQILIERSQAQQTATYQPSPAPGTASSLVAPPAATTVPVRPQPVFTPATPTPAPASSANALPGANVEEVHEKALQTLNQAQSGDGGALPKTKMQRLKDLTDLYRADKIGPAEYHQKRAQILAEPQ